MSTPFSASAADENKENVDPQSKIRFKPSSCAFVASLSARKTDDQLSVSVYDAFCQFGPIGNIKVLRDNSNRPYAFVQYTNDADCKRAIKGGPLITLDGRVLRVEQAKVNRTLYIDFGSVVNQFQVRQHASVFGETEKILSCDLVGNATSRFSSTGWFIQFVYRDDAIRAFANLANDSLFEVQWAQNIDSVQESSFHAAPYYDRRSVYVGHLPAEATEQALEQRFSRHGKVTSCTILCKKRYGKANYFAFITYEDDAGATRAVEVENHALFMTRIIHVQFRDHPKKPETKGLTPAPPPVTVRAPVKKEAEYYYVPDSSGYSTNYNSMKTYGSMETAATDEEFYK